MNLRLHSTTHILQAMFIGLAFLIMSCRKDPMGPLPEPDSGIPVKVQISFRVPKFSYPQQAGTSKVASENAFCVNLESAPISDDVSPDDTDVIGRSTGEPLYNMWVLQFKSDGTIRKVVRVSTTEKPIYENQTIDVELLTGSDQTIYMLSMGKQYGDTDLSRIGSLSELESTTFNFVRYVDGLPVPIVKEAADVPYRGSCDKLTIMRLEESGAGYVDYRNSPGFTGSISMKALVSLVTVDLSYKVDGMTPFSVALNNVPTTFVVNDANYKPSQFVNLPTVILNPTDLADGKRSTFSWYAAPNRQGVVSTIMAETNRYFYYSTSNSPVGTAPRDGTYIHFWASKDTEPNNYALYYLFLGSNTTNDFNIHPHSLYRYRTDINTADDINDKRIIFKTLKQTVDFTASSFVGTVPDGARTSIRNYNYDLDAHSDMRPMEITALRGTVTVEILAGSGSSEPPIAIENSWLKLSTYPNYTDALNGQRAGNATALATSITLNASIPGLFRLYLYSDEYEKYSFTDPRTSDLKRTLYVRFTFRTETDKSETYTAKMDQMPGIYAGQYGGEINMTETGASYPKGLVLESVSEHQSMQYLSYYPQSFSLYSAYWQMSLADYQRYHLYDNYNGKQATILTAENMSRLSPITAGLPTRAAVVPPRHIGEHVDLYQYKNYTGDVFTQRYCYDKNRDLNGNGYLDNTPEYSEIVWYVPANAQALSLGLNYFDDNKTIQNTDLGNATSITMKSSYAIITYSLAGLTTVNVSASSSQVIRCVRDVPIDPSGAGGVKVEVDADNYPVIDATGLMTGAAENRVNNPKLITPEGRVVRHYIGDAPHDIDKKTSQRFRVAPRDIDAGGNLVDKRTDVTWAQAAGYNMAANTLPITDVSTDVAETGCPVFKGTDGTVDPALGKWRLPTLREALLIGMMDEAMAATSSVTGYVPLYVSPDGYFAIYWTATERTDGSGDLEKNRAIVLSSSYKNTAPINQYARGRAEERKGQGVNHHFTRCIQDLP